MKMVYGYINALIALPQISEEMLKGERLKDLWKQFKELPDITSISKIFVREKNSRAYLLQTSPGKSLLAMISDITKEKESELHFLDRVENKLIESTGPGDIVITSTLLNFSRYLDQALKVVRFFYVKKVRVIALLEKFDSFAENRLMDSTIYFDFQVSRAVEQRNMRQNKEMQEIEEKIKDHLPKQGRKRFQVSDFSFFDQYFQEWDNGDISKGEFAEKLGISKATLTRLIDEYVSQKCSSVHPIS